MFKINEVLKLSNHCFVLSSSPNSPETERGKQLSFNSECFNSVAHQYFSSNTTLTKSTPSIVIEIRNPKKKSYSTTKT